MRHFLITLLMVGAFFCSSAVTTLTLEDESKGAAGQQQSDLAAVIAKLPKLSGYLQTGWNYSTAGNGTFQILKN